MVFHWIYTPFIYNIFFKFPNHLLKKENNIHFLIYLFGGKPKRNRASKRKHSKFNVPINIMQVPWNVLEMLLKFSSFLQPRLQPAYGVTSTLFRVFRGHIVFEAIYFFFWIQLLRERLSQKVHATIPKGIVGGFVFPVLQRKVKE